MKKEDAREMSRLDEDQLDGVSGGLVFYAGDIEGADKDNPWELLDDTDGRTLGRYPEKDDMCAQPSHPADRLRSYPLHAGYI